MLVQTFVIQISSNEVFKTNPAVPYPQHWTIILLEVILNHCNSRFLYSFYIQFTVLLLAECLCLVYVQLFRIQCFCLTSVHSFIAYATSTFDQVLEPLYMQLTHTPESKRDTALVETKMKQFHICAGTLSTHLTNKRFICGDKFTAADCVIAYNVWWASVIQQGALLQDYQILRQYLERVMLRPAFQKTFKGKKPVKPSGGSL